MTTATLTMAETVQQAHAALHMAMERPDCAVFTPEIINLADALETYGDLDRDALHWESVWPHLRDLADPDEAALLKAAEDVGSASGDLIAAMAAKSGIKSNGKNETAGVAS